MLRRLPGLCASGCAGPRASSVGARWERLASVEEWSWLGGGIGDVEVEAGVGKRGVSRGGSAKEDPLLFQLPRRCRFQACRVEEVYSSS